MTAVVTVLAYHRLGDPPPGGGNDWFYVREETFVAQLELLREHPVISLGQLLAGLDDPAALPPASVLITFDDADRSLLAVGLPHLVEFGFPAVAFVPTGYVGGVTGFDDGSQPLAPICSWADLRELAAAGVSIQAHGESHRRFSELGPDALASEMRACKATIEGCLGAAVDALAYPFGDGGRDPEAVEGALSEHRYRAAFLYGGDNPWPVAGATRYRLPRLPVGRDTDLRPALPNGA